MIRLRALNTLRAKGLFWVFGSLSIGVFATWLWMSSQAAWQDHLNRAFMAGTALYETLRDGTSAPAGISVELLETGGGNASLPSVSDMPPPRFVTAISINAGSKQALSGTRLQLHIVSHDLRYPVARLEIDANPRPAAQVGELARLLASYCSEPRVFARFDQGQWQQVNGAAIWDCEATPSDYRILAAVLLVLGTLLFLTQVTETSAQLNRFSAALRARGSMGGSSSFVEEGPEELRSIITTLNEYLAMERDRLEKRAMVMSAVSHDLGTPATRLRLRSALIEDPELRSKFEADIDQMAEMIESVLTYTRSEVNSEETRKISLTSLVQSIVADYEDVGKTVTYRENPSIGADKSRSVFGGGGNISLSHEDARRILVTARPVSLRRAITNLIENSLKYGRRATVYAIAGSKTASIIVEDEGSGVTADMMNSLTAPFQRGRNADFIEGVGLGLTIVSTIARQHGGSVRFEETSTGLRAILSISR